MSVDRDKPWPGRVDGGPCQPVRDGDHPEVYALLQSAWPDRELDAYEALDAWQAYIDEGCAALIASLRCGARGDGETDS